MTFSTKIKDDTVSITVHHDLMDLKQKFERCLYKRPTQNLVSILPEVM